MTKKATKIQAAKAALEALIEEQKFRNGIAAGSLLSAEDEVAVAQATLKEATEDLIDAQKNSAVESAKLAALREALALLDD